jgi:small-conductance mechanosensitive channel
MIDPADQLTKALPLDEQQAKKRRGRPATGKAMTPAEKQRAYRERLKSNVTDNMHKRVAEDLRADLAKALEKIEATEAKVRAEYELGEKARKRVKDLEAQLASRDQKPVKGLSYRKLTEAAFDQLKTNEKRADKKTASDWSFGTFLLWDNLAPWLNVQKAAYEADRDKMRELVGLDPKVSK